MKKTTKTKKKNKSKSKLKITLYVIVYIFAYLYLCILCNIGDPASVSQTPLRWLVFLLDSPITLLAMSWSIYLWIFVSFFLTLFIIWETDLDGPKLNRAAFIGIGILFLLTCISFMLTSYFNGSSILAVLVAIVFVIITCFGGGILFWYYQLKKQGKLDVYESYKDIMTEEEFNHWQERKHKND
ncbi:MAG: hypothetical protein LUG60_09010 [Erysipelotrichaceae bacterium]|nr:hypothetical protein [Erysipelotrichaceae bacterium]